MYFNDVHIVYYVVLIIVGIFIGIIIDWANKRLPEYKKVLSLDFFKDFKRTFKPNYILITLLPIIFVGLLYRFGIQKTLIANLDLIKYLILTPMLISVFVIDYRLKIIPNRLTLTMFEIGLVFTFLYGLSNVAISINMLLGMLAGGGIFLLITLLGGLAYGKEAMGLGDVKLMGALGLFFGLSNIIAIALVSFLIGAIISIILLATKIKGATEYLNKTGIPDKEIYIDATKMNIDIPSNCNVLSGVFYNNGEYKPYLLCNDYESKINESSVLKGKNIILLTKGSNYYELGYNSQNNYQISGTVNTNIEGVYNIYYIPSNSSDYEIEIVNCILLTAGITIRDSSSEL